MGRRKPKMFFKILIRDFTRQLMLSPAFVRKYRVLPENVKLRTCSGEIWVVKLEKIESEKYYFTRGWNEFVKDVGLKLGEVVVFSNFDIGKSTFDFCALGTDGCEKDLYGVKSLLHSASPHHHENVVKFSKENSECFNHDMTKKQLVSFSSVKNEETWTALENNSEADELEEAVINPCFEIVLNLDRKSRVNVRRKFAMEAGLIGKRAVVLQYPPKERYWAVRLDSPNYADGFRMVMTVGWMEFWRANGFVYGKTYSLEFDPNKNVILVKEVM